jgi:predicted GH43/DUF377 family glycosyl hydrolase
VRSDNSAGRAARAGAFGLLAGSLVLVSSAAATAQASFDFEQPVYYRAGDTAKDHSLVHVDGIYHLYYTAGSGKSLGYATSPDLRHWTYEGEIIQAGPDSWDSMGVWAPAVTFYCSGPGYYLMYYTGVNRAVAQRTCLAMSHVPYKWNKASPAVFTPFHGDTTWIRWNENEWSNYRDPGFYVEGDTFYLVHTVQTKDYQGGIGLARSTDYFRWEDAGPLYIHDNWHALESPFLMKRDGVYHLFFTEEAVGGVSHMSSRSLTDGWSILNRSIIDGGHAAEILDIGTDRYLFSRHTSYSSAAGLLSTIRVDTLAWNGDQPVVDMTNPLEGWTVLRGTAFDHQPTFGDNPRYRGDDTMQVGFEGNWWIGTYESFAGPLSGTAPGACQGDTARGAIRSAAFTITGRSMRLLVGGGAHLDSCYVALCDALDGSVLLRETGKNRNLMDERLWDLTPYGGRSVFILIVDDCSGPFGHINVDGIEERSTSVGPPHNGGDTFRVPDKGIRTFTRRGSASPSEDGTPDSRNAIMSRPNPFNPETEIVGRGAPGAVLKLAIYDIAGREIRTFSVRAGADGTLCVRWDGRDGSGAAVPSGVYFAALREGGRLGAVGKLVLTR